MIAFGWDDDSENSPQMAIPAGSYAITPQRKRMVEDMRVRNFSANSQRAHLQRVRAFAKYFGRSPATLGSDDIRAWQLHLIEVQQLSRSTLVTAKRFVAIRSAEKVRFNAKDYLCCQVVESIGTRRMDSASTFHLSFGGLVHNLNGGQNDPGTAKSLESQHGPRASLDRAMVLLSKVVEIFGCRILMVVSRLSLMASSAARSAPLLSMVTVSGTPF
jgi:Phage integrase, N-terminal SAM-like domain